MGTTTALVLNQCCLGIPVSKYPLNQSQAIRPWLGLDRFQALYSGRVQVGLGLKCESGYRSYYLDPSWYVWSLLVVIQVLVCAHYGPDLNCPIFILSTWQLLRCIGCQQPFRFKQCRKSGKCLLKSFRLTPLTFLDHVVNSHINVCRWPWDI